MFLDENHQRALQGYHSERNNSSSMQGAGLMVTAEVSGHWQHLTQLMVCRSAAVDTFAALPVLDRSAA
jgi:hypothetical protein